MTDQDKELIFLLAQKLTGAHPEGTFQHGIFLTNIEKRMRETKITSVPAYLKFAKENAAENSHLISALSIHTTSWFRENPHYVILQKIILDFVQQNRPFRTWSAAASTGEEVYSLALLFEEFRGFHPSFDYSIMGTDIDPVSLETAQKAVYDKKHLLGPVAFYKKHVLLGSGPTENYFTFTKGLRSRCQFKPHDIREPLKNSGQFELIVCRNILIYFPAPEVEMIIKTLIGHLRPGGHLILGHSEMIDYQRLGLSLRGHSVYQKPSEKAVKAAAKPEEAEPTILKKPNPAFRPELIVIGASTGGPQALSQVLSGVGSPNCPPIIIVQHIAAKFAHGFAENVSGHSGLKLGDTKDGTVLQKGHIYVSELDCHLGVELTTAGHVIRQVKKPAINGHRPSVDYLFTSVIDSAKKTLAILLSGMGHDGCIGMEQLHINGAYTMAQSEKDCVVFGMPKEAIDAKAVDFIGTAPQIQSQIVELIRRN